MKLSKKRILILTILLGLADNAWAGLGALINYDDRSTLAGASCSELGERHVHWADCGSYFECAVVNGVWQMIPKTCSPAGTMFDDHPSVKSCVDLFGWCPNKPPDFGPISKCKAADDKHVLEDDCSRYFRCHEYRDPGNFYPEILQCPGSQKFDDHPSVKQCVDGECPQNLIPLPEGPGWHCSELGDFNVLPTDCSKFYKCLRCSKNPDGWCYKELECQEGTTFDDTLKACVDGPCPQTLKELPGGPGWHCEEPGDLNVHPENCAVYYQCFKCSKPRGWCYIDMSCPSGHFFDEIAEKCIPSSVCPQDLVPLPPGWECVPEDDFSVNPDHCNMYYRCVPCSQEGGKCMDSMTCPDGKMFDDNINECVDGVCPGDLIPVDPAVHECTVQGEKNQDPENCAKYYECHKCSHGPGGWCYLSHDCPAGENFDETTEKCVASPCPQSLEELPNGNGFYCQHNGQTNVHPQDCSRWYVCYQCSKPKGWCVVYESCPAGQFFNDETDTCGTFDGCCPQTGCPKPPPPPPPPAPSSSSSSESGEGGQRICNKKNHKRKWKGNSCKDWIECKCYPNGQCQLFRLKCVYPTWFREELQCCVKGRYRDYCKNNGQGCWFGPINSIIGRRK